jgi:hypothetical protein
MAPRHVQATEQLCGKQQRICSEQRTCEIDGATYLERVIDQPLRSRQHIVLRSGQEIDSP